MSSGAGGGDSRLRGNDGRGAGCDGWGDGEWGNAKAQGRNEKEGGDSRLRGNDGRGCGNDGMGGIRWDESIRNMPPEECTILGIGVPLGGWY